MQVVLNDTSTLMHMTGVGHYCADLLQGLRSNGGEDQIDPFPAGWLRRSMRWGFGVRDSLEKRPEQGSTGKAIVGWAKGWVRQAARGACYRLLQNRFHALSRRYDLYHEPNYLPMPSQCPIVATWHDLSVLLYPQWHRSDVVARFKEALPDALDRCQHFITGSDFVRESLIRVLGIAPERVTRIYYGIRSNFRPVSAAALAQAQTELGLPPRYLLYAGTIEPRKNLLLLLQAYGDLPASLRREWPLVLVGKWGWNYLDVAAYFENIARHQGVIHIGYVPEQHLAAVYCGGHALLYPSHYEGFGLPPVEMLACGGVVITSTAEALRETIGDYAYQLDAHDRDGWRAAMTRLVTDQDWWQSFRPGACNVARRFTSEQCVAETRALYHRLIKDPLSRQSIARAA